jgi:putative flippase GtrA
MSGMSKPSSSDSSEFSGASDRRQGLRFIVVGTAAAAVHWGVVWLAVEFRGLAPLLANVAGWMIAFAVSFSGHRLWTFAATTGRGTGQSLWRFGLVSFGGFALNELSYAAVLRLGGWRYDLALGAVLVGVAAATFVVSRAWAFRPAGPRPGGGAPGTAGVP